MTSPDRRGGAPVGYLEELEPVEARAVMYLRLWCDGPDAQARVWGEFAEALGPDVAQSAVNAFGMLCSMCMRHGRRPLRRHHVDCRCFGGDESCFANFIGYASDGAHEDALMIATTIVRPDMAHPLVGLALEVGVALKRMALRPAIPAPQYDTPAVLH